MNKILETINATHGLNIKKEDFSSFKFIKPYFDKFLTMTIMDTPVLVYNLETPDKYLNENGIYPYLPIFYDSFQLSDDGYDDVDVIKIARYCILLQYVLGKIDPNNKFKFNIKDYVDPKFSRLVSFLSKFSLFGKFVLSVKDNIQQILRDCEKEKEENDKIIFEIKLREQQALAKNTNHDELVQSFQVLSAKSRTLEQKIENQSQILKNKIAEKEEISFKICQTKESLGLVKENKRKGLEEKNSLQAYMVKHPKQLAEELRKLKEETLNESEKQQVICQKIIGLKKRSKESQIISSKIPLLSNHLNLIKDTIENYEKLDNEIRTMQKPEIEINNLLATKREKFIKQIEMNNEKNLLRSEEINKIKMKIEDLVTYIGNLKEELKILEMHQQETLRQHKYNEDEILQISNSFGQIEEKYVSRKEEIDRNVEQSLNELKNIYSLKK